MHEAKVLRPQAHATRTDSAELLRAEKQQGRKHSMISEQSVVQHNE